MSDLRCLMYDFLITRITLVKLEITFPSIIVKTASNAPIHYSRLTIHFKIISLFPAAVSFTHFANALTQSGCTFKQGTAV